MDETAKKTHPIVRILWVDASASNDWKSKHDIEGETVGEPTITIGFLIKKPSKKVPMFVVASTFDPETEHFNAIMRIPKVWVKSVEELDVQPKAV